MAPVALSLIFLWYCVAFVDAVPVDVAMNRPISAYITCGSLGAETFISQKYLWSSGDVRERNTLTCYNDSMYPPSAMVDGMDGTFWQSTARPNFNQTAGGPDVVIKIDLQQVFELQVLTLKMGESLRPGRIVFYKSSTDPGSVQQWIYRVQSEQNCTKLYNTPSGTNNVVSVDSKLCQVYLVGPQALDEVITFDLTQVTIPNWRNGRYLMIEFYDIGLTLGIVGIPFQHYTVRTFNVMAECTCNGQQVACSQSNITGTFECVCGNNTQGLNCESCLPFFNQYEYKYGTACEACNCFNHSEVCVFNQTVANMRLSQNSRGDLVGGGVCQNCRDLTAGVNCQLCQPLYYRPLSVLQNSATPCVPCNCFGAGMQMVGLIGDCVMNANAATSAMMPGDCYCKTNVAGSLCDRCKNGYYNMSPTNPDGCQDCGCNANGTVAGNIACDVNGQCSCKQFVTNSRCDMCKDGYYGLDAAKLDGCTICMCDIGGSLPSGCSKDVGACTCRQGVTSNTCSIPASGYYNPDPHFIFSEFENIRAPWDTALAGYMGFGYVTALPQRPVSTVVTPPFLSIFSDQYQMVIRYSSTTAGSGTISVAGIDRITTMTLNMTFPACPGRWCYAPLGILNLPKGFTSTVTVTVIGTTDPRLFLDRLIALPIEYLNTTNLFGAIEDAKFQSSCNIINNGVMTAGVNQQYCMSKVFSLSTYYLNGALPCSCNILGSYSNGTCELYGGQCSCKPGTTGRQCDTCQIQFYGMTDQGCQACNCSNTAFKACDSLGQCLCPPGVQGANCDSCQDAYYNYDYSRGCTPCDCNVIGSIVPSCNATTGYCSCRSGVIGSRCDQCADGFWQLSYAGCLQCSCDPDGSIGNLCDKVTGQCQCKKNVQNQQCTSCNSSAFAKSTTHVDGCLACVCMGITNICQGAITFFLETTPPVALFNASLMPQIAVVTATLGPLSNKIDRVVMNGLEMASIQVQGSQVAYWQAPGLTGNLLQYYEGKVSFTVHWISSEPGVFALTNLRLLLVAKNNAQFFFMFPVASVQPNIMTNIDVVLSLENVIAAGQTLITRGQLLVAMAQAQGVLIPANYASQTHASRIGNLTYTMNPTNVEQCFCPPGYDGLSCENCSSGFMKTNLTTQGYLGNCIPCSCNSHSQLCIADTGQCINCMDNTAGFNCEMCADGFFRDSSLGPMSPCNPCPCYIPRVTNASCDILNGSLACLHCNPGYTGIFCDRCLPFYFGNAQILYAGTCSPCNCSGNSYSCDSVTGQCLNCLNNTIGFNCERCLDGYFGNASMQNCTSCGCNMNGSVSTICDSQTGQCSCIEGVGHRTCDQCLDYYYRPSSTPFFQGCLPCVCDPVGSSNLSCNVNGICSCKLNTLGDKCDSCQVGYWGLPQLECKPCACFILGTIDSLATVCDPHTGQCSCKPGVGNRACDACLPMYVNMTSAGCSACGTCETSLGNDTITLLNKIQDYWNRTLIFQQIQQQDAKLVMLQGIIVSAMNQTGLASGQDLVITLNALVQNLLSSADGYTNNFTALRQRINDVAASASQFLNDTSSQYMRVNSIKMQADQVRVDTGTQYMNVQNNVQTLIGYNFSAYQLLQTIQNQPTQVVWNWTGLFDLANQQTQDELGRALNTLSSVQQFNNTVFDQVNRASGYQLTLRQLSDSFAALNNAIASLNSNTLAILARLSSVMSKFNITLTNKATADNLWSVVQTIIATTDSILRQGQANLANAQQLVADCRTIIDGISSGALPINPINTTVDLTGITGWTQAYNLLVQQLQSIALSLTNYTMIVSQAERKASDLTQQAQAILLTFQRVQPRGQPAVDAINGFEKVVQLLDQALQMALTANNTMQQTLNQLQAVSINSIEASANQSLDASRTVKQNLDILSANFSASGLNNQLDLANASLQSAIQRWALIDARLVTFYAALTTLQNFASNFSFDADLTAGNAACDAAMQRLMDVTSQVNQLQTTVASQTTAVATLASDATNTTIMQSQLSANLSAFRNQLNNIVQAAVLSINSSESEVISLQPVLSQNLDNLVSKLAAVLSKMAALEQPVLFSGFSYESIMNPDSGISRLYNSVGLDFVPRQLKGVLFFTENNTTREKVLIQLVNSSIVFEYSNVDVTNTAISPATLEIGVWYRVYATRYAYDGQLTVIRMMTGGTAVTPMRTVSTMNTQLVLNSPLYIGGLLLSVDNRLKVYDNGIPYSGCIYNIIYNGAPVPLWQTILRKDSQASCCRKPAPIPSAPTISPCVTLYGFGFIKFLQRSSFSVVTQAQVAIQFRTFGPDGVILVVSSPATFDYYSIYLSAGTVMFAISASSNIMSLQTSNVYNDGQWYQVRVIHNPLSMQLTVTRMNQTVSSQPEVKQLSGLNFNLASLANLGFTIGGQNPDVSRGPIGTSFAGCVQDFQHSNALTSSMDLQPDSLTTGINSSAAVDLTKCYASVISGLGFLSTSSYASLRMITSPIQTLSFEIATNVPSGVIFYIQLPQNVIQTNLFLYVALYNGDIFIVFNQGFGIQPAFRSRGNYLSDGMIHKVALDFSFTNSPRMTIDTSEAHVGAITMNPSFTLLDGSIYVGGVPSTIGIDSLSCPVRISLVGGIRNIQINSGLINFFNPNVLTGNNVLGTYLSGLPTPPTSLPPLPYTTLIPPTPTPPPSCVVPTLFSYLNSSYLNFQGSTDSYVAYSSANLDNVMVNAFSVRLSFRSLQANGILFFISGSPTLAPANYFSIYMYAGYLRASMATNTSSLQTKNLQSLYTYNDGKWHEVEVLRVNDFLAVIVAENKDYINNQVVSTVVTSLNIGPTIYLGGVPSSLAASGYPFDSANILVGVKSFQGCVSNVSIIQYALQVTTLDTSREQSRQNVVPCQSNVTSGVFMNSSIGYVRVADSINVAPTFTLVPNFAFAITFRSATQVGTLMIAWSSSTRFIALVLTLGQVQVIMANPNGQFFSVTSRAQPSPLSICDNKPHSVVFTVLAAAVSLQVDGYAVETFSFDQYVYNPPQSVPIYLGGVRDSSWNVPSIFTPVTFQGCIQSVTISGTSYYITESTDSFLTISGCPI